VSQTGFYLDPFLGVASTKGPLFQESPSEFSCLSGKGLSEELFMAIHWMAVWILWKNLRNITVILDEG